MIPIHQEDVSASLLSTFHKKGVVVLPGRDALLIMRRRISRRLLVSDREYPRHGGTTSVPLVFLASLKVIDPSTSQIEAFAKSRIVLQ